MADPFNEHADVREHLAALGPAALADLRRILEAPSRIPHGRSASAHGSTGAREPATLIAIADTDEVIRLRLLRAIRDLSV